MNETVSNEWLDEVIKFHQTVLDNFNNIDEISKYSRNMIIALQELKELRTRIEQYEDFID